MKMTESSGIEFIAWCGPTLYFTSVRTWGTIYSQTNPSKSQLGNWGSAKKISSMLEKRCNLENGPVFFAKNVDTSFLDLEVDCWHPEFRGSKEVASFDTPADIDIQHPLRSILRVEGSCRTVRFIATGLMLPQKAALILVSSWGS